jgi:hypothetical protein
LAAILKILKTKSTTLSDNLFLCQISKESAVWSEFNIFKKNWDWLDKLCRSCHGNKKGGFKKNWIPFIKLHETM